MYRGYYRHCNCPKCNNCNNNDSLDDVLESTCSNMETLSAFDDDESCSCGFDDNNSIFPNNATLAQSYVPIQTLNETFKPCVGLKMGTLFPELVSPYYPCQSVEEIEFIKASNKIGKGCNA